MFIGVPEFDNDCICITGCGDKESSNIPGDSGESVYDFAFFFLVVVLPRFLVTVAGGEYSDGTTFIDDIATFDFQLYLEANKANKFRRDSTTDMF